jgi:hypothetical protein
MPLTLTFKGFNYVSYYNGGYENADSLPALVQTGSNAAALASEYGINVNNSTVYSDANYTDSLAAIGSTIAEAVQDGLSVMVRPLIDFLDPSKIGSNQVGDWRSYYNPANVAAFFASYQTMIVNEAEVAQANGATMFCIGTELDQLTGPQYLSYWTQIISAVRGVFTGKLTYSADWDDNLSPWAGHNGLTAGTGNLATQVSFWNQLDYVGVDEYAAISDAANPTLAQLIDGWTKTPTDPSTKAVTGNQSLISYFESVASATGKPLLFTELGYESASDAASQPAGSSTNTFAPALQSLLYQAFFDSWSQAGNNSLRGVYFWNWDPNAAEVGPNNGANFSPQGLEAQTVVTENFKRIRSASAPASFDFNGDGESDVLWRNTSGDAAIWNSNGSGGFSGQDLGVIDNSWQVAGVGDFNSDDKADILWRNTSGEAAIWNSNGSGGFTGQDLGTIDLSWKVAGVGDFNGNGEVGILWRNTSGEAAIWNPNGSGGFTGQDLGTVDDSWQVDGVGDFNGDGDADILWSNRNGDAAIWNSNGSGGFTVKDLGTAGSGWQAAGVGDFNGDGDADILWRDANGDTAIWNSDGSGGFTGQYLGVLSASYQVAAIGDFNGDGKSDIFWRNQNGDALLWNSNSSGSFTPQDLGIVSTSYRAQDL